MQGDAYIFLVRDAYNGKVKYIPFKNLEIHVMEWIVSP